MERNEIENLRNEILDYLETEAVLMPVSIVEACEVENADEDELIEKAKELGINYSKYI